jgi:hypothetical protein
MGGKLLFLTGAPDSKALDWSLSELLSDFIEPLTHFAHRKNGSTPSSGGAGISLKAAVDHPEHAVWRSIPLKRTHLTTGFSQQHFAFFNPGPQRLHHDFFTTASFSCSSVPSEGQVDDDVESAANQSILSQFYEHSLAIHEDIPSSVLVPDSGLSQESSLFISDEDTSFQSTQFSPEQLTSVKEPLGIARTGSLSDLEDIPPASYLTSIEPATMTVNLLVGIISIAAPRTVQTRWGSTRTLVEVLVGDETKSGFAVTFWLPSHSVAESVLAGLRAQDVVLLQNVALNVFSKKVYGSSLRKDLTKVHLLYRKKLDSSDKGGYYSAADLHSSLPGHPQLEKTRRAWDWVLRFVHVGQGSHDEPAQGQVWDIRPPLDTQ